MRRYHLTFSYVNPDRGHINHGSEVVFASGLEQAALSVASARGVDSLTVKRRYHANGQVDEINREYRHVQEAS